MSVRVFWEGKYWHYRFRVAGKRIQRTTRQPYKCKHIAQQIADKAYQDACDLAVGVKPIPTLRQLIDQWRELRGPAVSESHRRGMDIFQRNHLYDLGEVLISELDTERVTRAFNRHLASRKPSSANHWLAYLKLVFNWAIACDIIKVRPWKLKMMAVQQPVRMVLPSGKTQAWLAAIDRRSARNPSTPLAVRLMLDLGLRETEAATARWEWVDWERKTYTPGITKGKEAVPVPMSDWLVNYLRPLRRPAGPMTPGRLGRQLPAGYSRRAIARANLATGVTGITPHRLRSTCATQMSENGTPVQTIQAMLRHKKPTTTMRYLEVDLDVAAAAQARRQRRNGMEGVPGRKSGGHRESNPRGR